MHPVKWISWWRQYKKWKIEWKWIESEYYMQEDDAVANKYVNMFFNTTQFPLLTFCGPQVKPNGVWWLSKNYHIRLYQKLGHGTCTIWQIPWACSGCKSMLDKPSNTGVIIFQQTCYQPVQVCTYWPVLGSFNNCNIITFYHKDKKSEDFEEIY